MSRTPIDNGLFVDQWWSVKRRRVVKSGYQGAERIRITQIYRKDRQVMYEPENCSGMHLLMQISYLRANFDPETIYVP